MCYNTLSPLENHHCAVAFELVHTPATNIFVNFCDKEFATVRQNTVRYILGTDMAKHTDILEAFTAKMVEHSLRGENSEDNQSVTTVDAVNGVTAPNFSQLAAIFDDDDESHTLTMVVLLKMCDISTEIRPDEVAQPWLDGLINELAAQAFFQCTGPLPTPRDAHVSAVAAAVVAGWEALCPPSFVVSSRVHGGWQLIMCPS
uniref:PDEase domain-containing protein n=1 Tax=Mesocestoides corti TaxID=53468 RepID=A0A5K3FZI8_MESCO